jgi:hypothetical protein
VLPLRRPRPPPPHGGHPRGRRRAPRAAGARLARRPHRRERHRPDGPRHHARHPSALHRPGGPSRGLRPHALHGEKARRAHRQRHPRRRRLLPLLLLVPHGRLQGPDARRAARGLLPRPARPAHRHPPRGGALSLQHQHLPQLGAGAPLPLPGPQRRDQHPQRQPRLDARPRGPAGVAPLRRGHRGLQAHHPIERVGQRLARQRRRLPRRQRPQPAARDDDARARGDRRRGDVARAQGLLRLPRVPHRALGRPRRARLLRRRPRGRHARPQRAAPRQVGRHQRRAGGARQRARGAPARPGHRGAEGEGEAGEDVPGGYARGEGAARRGGEAPGGHAPAVPRLARGEPHRPRRAPPRPQRVHPLPRRPPAAAPGLRLHRGRPHPGAPSDGRHRRGGHRLDGRRRAARRALRAPAEPLPILQAAVRPGDQPPHRPHPRGGGDVDDQLRRRRREPPRRDPEAVPHGAAQAPGAHQRRRRPAATQRARRLPRLHPRDALRPPPTGRSAQRRIAPPGGPRHPLPRGPRGGALGRLAADPVRPRRGPGARAHPLAARPRGGAPLPHPNGPSHEGRHRRGVGRAPGGESPRAAGGLRRGRGEPLPRHGDRGRPRALRGAVGRARRGREVLREGPGEGAPEGDVQDGHQRGLVLPGSADLRGRRRRPGRHRPLLRRHLVAHPGRRARRDRPRGPRPPRPRLWGAPRGAPRRGGTDTPAHEGRGAPLDREHPLRATARGARGRRRHLRGLGEGDQRAGRAAAHPERRVGPRGPAGQRPGARRGGGARGGDREALRDRGDELRDRSPRRPTRPSPSR